MVTVNCVFNNVSNVYLTISNVLGITYDDRDLTSSPASVVFDIPHYPIGTYVITLYCDGIPVDSKTFVKN